MPGILKTSKTTEPTSTWSFFGSSPTTPPKSGVSFSGTAKTEDGDGSYHRRAASFERHTGSAAIDTFTSSNYNNNTSTYNSPSSWGYRPVDIGLRHVPVDRTFENSADSTAPTDPTYESIWGVDSALFPSYRPQSQNQMSAFPSGLGRSTVTTSGPEGTTKTNTYTQMPTGTQTASTSQIPSNMYSSIPFSPAPESLRTATLEDLARQLNARAQSTATESTPESTTKPTSSSWFSRLRGKGKTEPTTETATSEPPPPDFGSQQVSVSDVYRLLADQQRDAYVRGLQAAASSSQPSMGEFDERGRSGEDLTSGQSYTQALSNGATSNPPDLFSMNASQTNPSTMSNMGQTTSQQPSTVDLQSVPASSVPQETDGRRDFVTMNPDGTAHIYFDASFVGERTYKTEGPRGFSVTVINRPSTGKVELSPELQLHVDVSR